MTGAFAGRDSSEIDALVTDRYLETLLAAHGRGADGAPTASIPPDTIRATAGRLARDLPRLHPSFRFEEALAARLADVALRMRSAAVGEVPALATGPDPADRDAGAPIVGLVDPRSIVGRPLIIGGALTSAALSIAGAAYVAWRLNRPASPMARAARAVSRTRLV